MSEIRKRTIGDTSAETRDVSDDQVNTYFFVFRNFQYCYSSLNFLISLLSY